MDLSARTVLFIACTLISGVIAGAFFGGVTAWNWAYYARAGGFIFSAADSRRFATAIGCFIGSVTGSAIGLANVIVSPSLPVGTLIGVAIGLSLIIVIVLDGHFQYGSVGYRFDLRDQLYLISFIPRGAVIGLVTAFLLKLEGLWIVM